ncbi:hypothetical protein CH274_22045 [Rhodococcus sp. 06-418-5]|jgi:phenylpyruvate tautomerase PptA (4-oxalocrotonate tautomerase family)|uniref:tautomerase family protein n=1 Tax=Rhodococcus sp. 06-418-5 TaxID=2022507 RepID=UPI000B9A5C01|nr:tautomerase family protein [Rhodococcus sp. 06-418-5]OZC74692.1 hypothetical protein CH274_22045 [Rhodococcus sp. 06-418-5]
MPFTTIELHEGSYDAQQREAISDAIHDAMIETLAIPEDDRIHFFHVLPRGSIFHERVMFGVPRTERLFFLTFSFNTRSARLKNALYESTVRHLAATAGVQSDEVVIRIVETASENWWAEGRSVDPETGYDTRMTNVPT